MSDRATQSADPAAPARVSPRPVPTPVPAAAAVPERALAAGGDGLPQMHRLAPPQQQRTLIDLQRTHGNAHVRRRLATLKAGARHANVRLLQEQLNASAPSPRPLLVVDGDFGPKTAAAVFAFQRRHGLAADGIVGRRTWAALAGAPPGPAQGAGPVPAAAPTPPVAPPVPATVGGATASDGAGAGPAAEEGAAPAAAGADLGKKLHKAKGKPKGLAGYAGDRLETTLRRLLKEQGGVLHVEGRTVALSEEEIGLLQGVAAVETGGLTTGINSWDSDVMSMGFMQYTMAEKLQKLIKRAPTAFAKYGIRLGGKLRLKGKWVEGIAGAATADELRGPEWGARFLEAGLDPEIVAAQVEMAKAIDLPKVAPQTQKLPVRTDRVKRIILELHNNRPAYVKYVVPRTIARAGDSPTEAAFVAVLRSVMQDVYAEQNRVVGKGGKVKFVNGKTDAEARAKAARIVDKND